MHVRALCFTVLMLVAGGPGERRPGRLIRRSPRVPPVRRARSSDGLCLQRERCGRDPGMRSRRRRLHRVRQQHRTRLSGSARRGGARLLAEGGWTTSGGESAGGELLPGPSIRPPPRSPSPACPSMGAVPTSASFGFFADEPSAFYPPAPTARPSRPCQPDPGDPGNSAKGTQGLWRSGRRRSHVHGDGHRCRGQVAALGFKLDHRPDGAHAWHHRRAARSDPEQHGELQVSVRRGQRLRLPARRRDAGDGRSMRSRPR